MINLLSTLIPPYLKPLEMALQTYGLQDVLQLLGICLKMEPFRLLKSSHISMDYSTPIFSNASRLGTLLPPNKVAVFNH